MSKSRKPGKSSQPSTVSNFIKNQNDDQNEDADESLKYFKSIKSTMKNTQVSSTQSSSAVLGFINKASDSPKKISKKSSPKRATRKPSTRKKNQPDIRKLLSKDEQLVHKVLEASCRENNLDPDDVQLAIALSESMKEQPESKENLQKFENPFASSGKVQSVNAVLERFGFKAGKALSEYEQEILTSTKFSKRSKFQKAPTLLTRTSNEDRNAIIQNRIVKIIDQEPLSDHGSQIMIDFDIYSSHLREFHMQINSIASLENSEEPCDNAIQKYYVTDLFQPSFLQADYLLRDWNQIPGRDRSPQKENRKDDEEEVTASEDFWDGPAVEKKSSENIDDKKFEDEKDQVEDEKVPSLNSSCSDIFADVESFKIDECAEDISHVSQQLDILHEKLSRTDFNMEVDEEPAENLMKNNENQSENDLTLRSNLINKIEHPKSPLKIDSTSLNISHEIKNPENSYNVDLTHDSSKDSELKELEEYFKIAKTSSEIEQPENSPKIDLTVEGNKLGEKNHPENFYESTGTSKYNKNSIEENLEAKNSPQKSFFGLTPEKSQTLQQNSIRSQIPIEIDLTIGYSDESSTITRKSSQMSIPSRKSSKLSINNDSDNTIEYEIPPVAAYKSSQTFIPQSSIKIDLSSDDEVFDMTQRGNVENSPAKKIDGDFCDLTQVDDEVHEDESQKSNYKEQNDKSLTGGSQNVVEELLSSSEGSQDSQNHSQSNENLQNVDDQHESLHLDPQNYSQGSENSQNDSKMLESSQIYSQYTQCTSKGRKSLSKDHKSSLKHSQNFEALQNSENNSQVVQNSSLDLQNVSQFSQNENTQDFSQNSSSNIEVIDISDDEINYSMKAFNDQPQSDEIEILEIENLNSNENSPIKNNYEDLNFKSLLNETAELIKTPMVAPRVSLHSNQSTKKFFDAENLSDSLQDIIRKYGGKKSETPKRNSFRKYQSESSIKLNDSGKSVVDLTQDENNFDLTQNDDKEFGGSQEVFDELERSEKVFDDQEYLQGSQKLYNSFNFNSEGLEDLENIPEHVLESSINKSLANIINSPAISRTRKSLVNRRKSRKSLITSSNEKYEIDTENFIPECDFKSMTPAELKKELFKYGIRPLPVKKAVELLQHIYDSIHPKIRVAAEEEIDVNDSRMDLNQTDVVCNIACTGDDDDFVFKYGEIEGEEFIMPKMRKSKIPSCAYPLQIAFYNMIRSNPQLQKFILEFRPLDLDMIHKHFRKFGLSFQLNDIIGFLDKRCITFKTKDQSYSKTHEAKRQRKLKKFQKN